jgi:hypothetical protein
MGRPFDVYLVFFLPGGGVYSVQPGNSVAAGVKAYALNIPAMPGGFSGTVFNMVVPPIPPGQYSAIIAFFDAGKKVSGGGAAFLLDQEVFDIP